MWRLETANGVPYINGLSWNFQFVNSTTPSTPGSGKTNIFVDSTTKKLSTVDDAGLVRALAAEPYVGATPPSSPLDGNRWLYRPDPIAIVNATFDSDITSWTKTDAGGASVTGTWDSGTYHTASGSLKVVNTTSTEDSYYSQNISGLKGGIYEIEAWVNCTAFTSGAVNNRCLFGYDTGANTNSGFTTLTATTSGWVKHRALVPVSGGTLSIRLYAPNGTVYYDDVKARLITEWEFVYDSARSATYPWYCVGGLPSEALSIQSRTTSGSGWWADPILNLPFAGDYQIGFQSQANATSNSDQLAVQWYTLIGDGSNEFTWYGSTSVYRHSHYWRTSSAAEVAYRVMNLIPVVKYDLTADLNLQLYAGVTGWDQTSAQRWISAMPLRITA